LQLSDPRFVTTLYQTRDQYLSNAQHAIALREYRKASELLWGAVTQQLKALAATYNVVITSHRQFFDFLRQVAAELKDKPIYADFVELNALHKNFYDEVIPPDLFPDFYERTIRYIERLDAFARKDKSSEGNSGSGR
jgi:hypothetical protein